MISKIVYERLLLELIDYQLKFETFAQTIKILDDERLFRRLIRWDPGMEEETPRSGPRYDLSDLRADYGAIESYLNEKIKEFGKNLHCLPDRGKFPLAK